MSRRSKTVAIVGLSLQMIVGFVFLAFSWAIERSSFYLLSPAMYRFFYILILAEVLGGAVPTAFMVLVKRGTFGSILSIVVGIIFFVLVSLGVGVIFLAGKISVVEDSPAAYLVPFLGLNVCSGGLVIGGVLHLVDGRLKAEPAGKGGVGA